MNFFSPAEIANNYIGIGKAKVSMRPIKQLILGILAGFFIAFGGVASQVVAVSIEQASIGKFLGACVFPGGLIMVLLAGSELFTGNCLLPIPLLQKEIRLSAMLRNWGLVYLGNLIGSVIIGAMVIGSHQASLFGNALAVSMISMAVSKVSLTFIDAFLRGILCNILVCIAVWISFAAKDVVGKIVGLFFPVMLFVLCGFEHCVANMYFISTGLFAKSSEVYYQAAVDAGINPELVTIGGFFGTNLLPVTLGNIVGGAICVGCIYWFIYCKKEK